VRPIVLAGIGLLAAGCGGADQLVRTRGAFDFKCPAAQVSVTQLSESTYGADGCGQRTVYTLKCPRGAMAESECNLAREPSPPAP
jgi:hypothetical protein